VVIVAFYLSSRVDQLRLRFAFKRQFIDSTASVVEKCSPIAAPVGRFHKLLGVIHGATIAGGDRDRFDDTSHGGDFGGRVGHFDLGEANGLDFVRIVGADAET
jgi:hypothetical protein